MWKELLKPTSPVRSKRVQGAVITLAALALALAGYPIGEQGLTELSGAVGALWFMLGTIKASKSPRPF